ncbi:MAG: CsbD family protein [Chloroflexi bacterium]|nr:CsbD family protein [Chloroflexota bacterium]
MTQERVEGKVTQGKGKVKEEVGKFLGDRSSQWSGKLDQVKGKVQEKIGEAKSTRRFADGRTR